MTRTLIIVTGSVCAAWLLFVAVLGIQYDMFERVMIGGIKILAAMLLVVVPVLLLASYLWRRATPAGRE
jgi:hypothetical protein